MKKTIITMAAVLASVGMSAQNIIVANTATGSSQFYFNEQATVSFWGQPKGDEQNGDLTVNVTEVGEDYAILTFFLNEASAFSSYGIHFSTDGQEWSQPYYALHIDENATIPFGATNDWGNPYNGYEIRQPYSKGITQYTVTGLESNTTYFVRPYATTRTHEGTFFYMYGTAKQFQTGPDNVEPELEPLEEDETIDIADEINEETDIDGNVIGNIFYNINPENGSYADGCLVVTTPTNDDTVEMEEGTDIFGEDFKAGFTGIVFMVPAGSGVIKITAETTGNTTLKVKIGNNAPIEMELEGKLKATFPYNVSKPTYVYIYAGVANSDGKHRAPSSVNELKIYGVELKCDPIPTDIEQTIADTPDTDSAIYNLSGQRLTTPQKGINIVRKLNGTTRKVIIK